MPMKTCAETSGRIAISVASLRCEQHEQDSRGRAGQPPVALAAAVRNDGAYGRMRPVSPSRGTSSTGHLSGHG